MIGPEWIYQPATLPATPASSSQENTPREPVLSALSTEAGFFAIMIGACLVGAGRAVQVGFTPASVLLGIYLFRKSQVRYISFVLWLWFLSPFVRRMADYHAGFQEPSQILLAPIAVSLLCAFALLTRFSLLFRRQSLSFSLAGLAVLYGFLLGALHLPLQAVLVDCLRWLTPLVFAFYCFALCSRSDMETVLRRTVLCGTAIMGVYGIWQNFRPAPWDLYWLSNVDASSFGSASGDSVRVFSTMNSPGPFAATMAANILLLFGVETKSATVAQVVCLASLILSEVRSAWIGIAAGLLWLLFRSSRATRRRMLLFAVLACTLLGFAAVSQQNVSRQLLKRFSTFADLRQDESYEERMTGSQRALSLAFHNPFGEGMGFLDTDFSANADAGGSDLGKHDDGIYEFLVTLGFCGSLFYGLAVAGIVGIGFSRPSQKNPWHAPLFAACLSFLVEVPSGNTLQGVDGFIFWLAAAAMLSGSAPLGLSIPFNEDAESIQKSSPMTAEASAPVGLRSRSAPALD